MTYSEEKGRLFIGVSFEELGKLCYSLYSSLHHCTWRRIMGWLLGQARVSKRVLVICVSIPHCACAWSWEGCCEEDEDGDGQVEQRQECE